MPAKRIGLEIVRNAHVPHLGMNEAVHQATVHHAATADARANRQVEKRVQRLSRAPAPLGQRRGVDVRVEADRHVERVAQRAGDVHVRPPGFRRRGDEAERGRGRLHVDRTERGNAHRRHFAQRGLGRAEERRLSREASHRAMSSESASARACRPGPCRPCRRTSCRRLRPHRRVRPWRHRPGQIRSHLPQACRDG